ncbi:sulfotransferase family 2 domain-containing protein [Allochromatium warmingii]|nr:sulfotransferase family 2 domain-containing protein [Allochromatium warmingii]
MSDTKLDRPYLSSQLQTLRSRFAQSDGATVDAVALFNFLVHCGRLGEAEQVAQAPSLAAEPMARQQRRSATIAQRADRWAAALTLWSELFAAQPEDLGLLRNLAQCYRALGEPAAAVRSLEQLVANDRASPNDHLQLLTLKAQMQGESVPPKALEALYLNSPTALPIAIPYLNTLPPDAALEAARELLAHFPAAPSIWLFINALQQKAGDLASAEATLILARSQCVDDTPIVLRYIQFLSAQQRDAEAQKLLDDALCGVTDQALRVQSRLYSARDQPSAALHAAIAAFRLCPNVDGHQLLARAMLQCGRYIPAHRLFARLKHEFAGNVSAWIPIAHLDSDLDHGFEAIDWLRRARDTGLAIPPPRSYAAANWLVGDEEETWIGVLAAAFNEPRLLMMKPGRRREMLAELADRMLTKEAQCYSVNADDRSVAIASWSESIPSLYEIKAYKPLPPAQREALTALDHAARTGAAAEGLAALTPFLEPILASTSSQTYSRLLLWRLAALADLAGQPEAEISYLINAAQLDPREPLCVGKVQRSLRRLGPVLSWHGNARRVVMIVSCAANLQKAKALAHRLRIHDGPSVMIIKADNAINSHRLETEPFGYVMTVPGDDGYLALPNKVAQALRFLYACTNCRSVIKVDDDVAVSSGSDLSQFFAHLDLAGHNYAGKINKRHNPIYLHYRATVSALLPPPIHHRSIPYCNGGWLYYLSRKSLKCIFTQALSNLPPNAPGIVFEDLYVAELLSEQQITPTDVSQTLRGLIAVDTGTRSAIAKKLHALNSVDQMSNPSASSPRYTLIVTHGRSGSTLLNGLLNAIDGWSIKGENNNLAYGLYLSWKSLAEASSERKNSLTTPQSPWFGLHDMSPHDYAQALARPLLSWLEAGVPLSRHRCLGFKEIRYFKIFRDDPSGAELAAYLSFLTTILTPCRLVLLTRDPEQTARSAWWQQCDQEPLRADLRQFADFLQSYATERPEQAFYLTYDDLVTKGPRVDALFAFLGEKPSPTKHAQVFARPHSYNQRSLYLSSVPENWASPNLPAQLRYAHSLQVRGRWDEARHAYREVIASHGRGEIQQPPLIAYTRAGAVHVVLRRSDTHRLAAAMVPKVACSSISHLLYQLDHGGKLFQPRYRIHDYFSKHQNVVSDARLLEGYCRFAVIRDPVERFISGYRNRILFHADAAEMFAWNMRRFEPLGINEFAEKIDEMCQYSKAILQHFSPQRLRLGDDLTAFDAVYPLEDMAGLANHLSDRVKQQLTFGHFQTGGPEIGLEALSPATLEDLITHYAEDYALLASWYTPERIRDRYRYALAHPKSLSMPVPEGEGKLCFVSIHRSVDTALLDIINTAANAHVGPLDLIQGDLIAQLLDWPRPEIPYGKHFLISGAIGFAVAKRAFPRRRLFIMLSNPVDLRLKCYFNILEQQKKVYRSDTSTKEILDCLNNHEDASAQIHLAAYLLDQEPENKQLFPAWQTLPNEEVVNRCVRVLSEEFSAFGLTERYHESLALFGEQLSLTLALDDNDHRHDDAWAQVSDEVRQALEVDLSVDMAIYRAALELFAKRWVASASASESIAQGAAAPIASKEMSC